MNELQKVFNKVGSFISKRDYNLFGTIASARIPIPKNTKDFIPTDANGGILDLTDEYSGTAKWMGLESKQMQFLAYRYCAPLAGVIERIAVASANGRMEFHDEDGNTIKNYRKNPKLLRIKKLWDNPNKFQTREEFDIEQISLAKIFGYCLVLSVCPAGMDKSYTIAQININPLFANPVINENYSIFGNQNNLVVNASGAPEYVWDGVNREDKIKEWTVTIGSNNYTIPASDILIIKDGVIEQTNPQNGLPISKISGLDFNISNINAAMEADNVLLKKKGPLGVFSGDAKPDIAGMTPMPPTEQDDLQIQLSKYGLTVGQVQHVISRWPIKWNPVSFNARDLMTKETARMGIDSICDRLDYPAELMSGKNATYENRSSSEKFLYQNNIIPFSIRRTSIYNKLFGLEDTKIFIDYSHLPILQEDILHAGNAAKSESESLVIEWEAGQITWNQWQTEKGRDEVAGMDIYYPDYIAKYPNMDKKAKPEKSTIDGKDTKAKN